MPYVIPYAYPYPVAVEPEPAVQPEEAEPEGPAPTIFDRRGTYMPPSPQAPSDSRYGDRYLDSREQPSRQEPTPPAPQAKTVVHESFPTVLVFKDGHRREVANYAIVGDSLYELGTAARTFRLKLAELDVPATIKANEANGVEFSLPVASQPAQN